MPTLATNRLRSAGTALVLLAFSAIAAHAQASTPAQAGAAEEIARPDRASGPGHAQTRSIRTIGETRAFHAASRVRLDTLTPAAPGTAGTHAERRGRPHGGSLTPLEETRTHAWSRTRMHHALSDMPALAPRFHAKVRGRTSRTALAEPVVAPID